MRKALLISISFSLFIYNSSCLEMNSTKNKKEIAKLEIEKTELAFSKMAADSGIEVAFAYYASENAIIKRQNDSLIMGITGIRNFYKDQKFKKVKLSWKPYFIDVSASADLGYTFGKYEFVQTDRSGKVTDFKGIFHTVWKKTEKGEWKFVWD